MRTLTLALLGLLSLMGMIGVALAVILGFEEVPGDLLLVSTAALVLPVMFLLADLVLRKASGRRRVLVRALLGRRAPRALAVCLRLATR